MRLKSYDRISDNAKRLAQMHQFRPEPLLLMLSALGGGAKQQHVWSNLALQKFLHREVRIFDEAVYGVKLRFNQRHQRWAQILTTGQSRRLGDVLLEDDHPSRRQSRGVAEDEEAEEDEEADEDEPMTAAGEGEEHDCPKPTCHSPVFNTLYGQNMLTTRSYQSALCELSLCVVNSHPVYFFRAYEVDEYDPFLCFLIAQAYLGRALNRQSDNRNYQIGQVCRCCAMPVLTAVGLGIHGPLQKAQPPGRCFAGRGRVQLWPCIPQPW
jgi:general transcription factor 3C polypeptide 3 (transcription factor C subunit 4)